MDLAGFSQSASQSVLMIPETAGIQTRNDKTALRLAVTEERLDRACHGSHGGDVVGGGMLIFGVGWELDGGGALGLVRLFLWLMVAAQPPLHHSSLARPTRAPRLRRSLHHCPGKQDDIIPKQPARNPKDTYMYLPHE